MSAYCSPTDSDCCKLVAADSHGCMVPCTGLYADVAYVGEVSDNKARDMVSGLAGVGRLIIC